jgi:amidase
MTSTLSAADVDRIVALDATGQAALVRGGELTPKDLLWVAIDRIERLNPTLNAVVIKAYDAAEHALRDGLPAGPFTGVPYLLKDLGLEAQGLPLHEGSRFLKDYVSDRDSTVVTRLRASGLVVLGRTGSCEFGMKPTVETRIHGATRNPWDVSRSTGGSSGGSAAAVASAMVPMAGANDAGGSIRIPASACGVFGLKPTRARNPYGPHYGDIFGGVCAEHAVTRTVRDSAALLDATNGPEPGDPYAVPPPAWPYVDEVGAPTGRLRIAFTSTPSDGRHPDPACVAAVQETARLCEELGHEVFERDLVELTPDVGEAIGTMYGAAVDWCLKYWARELGREPTDDDLEPFTRALWGHGKAVGAGSYLMAVTVLQSFSRDVARAMTDFDVWLSPTLGTLPPWLGTMTDTEEEPWRGNDIAADLVSFPLVTANVSGNPAMSVPLSWSDEGLPIGSHFMAGYGREDVLFRLAGQLEEARPWAGRRPPQSLWLATLA